MSVKIHRQPPQFVSRSELIVFCKHLSSKVLFKVKLKSARFWVQSNVKNTTDAHPWGLEKLVSNLTEGHNTSSGLKQKHPSERKAEKQMLQHSAFRRLAKHRTAEESLFNRTTYIYYLCLLSFTIRWRTISSAFCKLISSFGSFSFHLPTVLGNWFSLPFFSNLTLT